MSGPKRWNKFNKYKKKNSGDAGSSKDDPEEPETHPDNSNEEDPSLNVYAARLHPETSLYAFHLYFDKPDKFTEQLILEKASAAQKFFSRTPDITTIIPSKSAPSLHINMTQFYADETFMTEWKDFNEDIKNNPRESLNILGLALHQVFVQSKLSKLGPNAEESINKIPMIRIKVINYKPLIALRDIKIDSYGKLIATRGCVIRVGRPKYMTQWLPFSCDKCNHWMVIKLPDGIYTLPKKCKACGTCKFTPRWESPHVKTAPYLVIKLQEHFDDKQDEKGKMPRIVEVELIEGLVDSCMPGDDITIVGIIKIRGTDDGTENRKNVEANALYIEAISVMNNKNKSRNRTALGLDLDHQDYVFIKHIHDAPDVFPMLVRSLCPAIYGNEIIKAGLLLSLFGGCAKHDSLRNDLHVLLVGDPGLGKSQLLQACSRVCTKGVYVCGNSSTTSGLTVTLTKENGMNDFALEPGALVLADKGTCFIDEFDKMPTQHQALLEAMEQSSVSVAKSGIICSLPARTSIVAAANPIGGKYNRAKSFTENLNLSEPLLSRFDLIFLLLDEPSEQMDALMCDHVMSAHTGFKKVYPNRSGSNQNEFTQTALTLKQRLTGKGRQDDLIPQSILRKYVSYARLYVKPKLTPSAADKLRDYYLLLRQKNNIFGHLPVFHRQLEALIRLTEARAKLELRTEATDADALEVIEIYKHTLASVPSLGGVGPSLSHETGKITGNKVSAFISLLQERVQEKGESLFSKTELMEIANFGGIVINEFSRFISKLNEQGYLIKRGHDLYKFVDI